jgi:hypothetical protein
MGAVPLRAVIQAGDGSYSLSLHRLLGCRRASMHLENRRKHGEEPPGDNVNGEAVEKKDSPAIQEREAKRPSVAHKTDYACAWALSHGKRAGEHSKTSFLSKSQTA